MHLRMNTKQETEEHVETSCRNRAAAFLAQLLGLDISQQADGHVDKSRKKLLVFSLRAALDYHRGRKPN